MTTATNLTAEATKLLQILQQTGGGWDNTLMELLYNKPEYSRENAANYWQWEANAYGNETYRPVNGQHITFTASDNYSRKLSAAYQELRKAGLAGERNSGYNDYWLYPIK